MAPGLDQALHDRRPTAAAGRRSRDSAAVVGRPSDIDIVLLTANRMPNSGRLPNVAQPRVEPGRFGPLAPRQAS